MRRHVAFCLLLLLPWTTVPRPGPIPGLGSKPLSALVDVYLPWLAKAPPILIAAAYIDSARSGEADEAIMLWNVGSRIEPLAGWQVESSGRRTTVPATSSLALAPGGRLWLAAEALAFRQSFGDLPAAEWIIDTDPLVLDLQGTINLPNSRRRAAPARSQWLRCGRAALWRRDDTCRRLERSTCGALHSWRRHRTRPGLAAQA